MTLPPPAAHDRCIWPLLDERERLVEPAVDQDAIAIDELDEANVWSERLEGRQTFIPCPCCGEGLAQIQSDHRGPDLFRCSDTAVGGTRVDIDNAARIRFCGLETADQALAFVSADSDDADVIRNHWSAEGLFLEQCGLK